MARALASFGVVAFVGGMLSLVLRIALGHNAMRRRTAAGTQTVPVPDRRPWKACVRKRPGCRLTRIIPTPGVGLACILFLAIAACGPSQDPGPATCRIDGRVRGSSEVAGAEVVLEWPIGEGAVATQRRATTNEHGGFEFADLPPLPKGTRCRLTTRARGHETGSHEFDGALEWPDALFPQIHLDPMTPDVCGRCVDEHGAAVAGAEVRIVDRRNWKTTDADGRFKAEQVSLILGDVWIDPVGYAPLRIPGPMPGNEPTTQVDLGDVVLRPGASLSGTFVDAERRPVAHGIVQASPGARGSREGWSRWTETREDGTFVLTALPDMPIELRAIECGPHAAGREAVLACPGPAKDVQIALRAGLRVTFRFVTSQGAEVRTDHVWWQRTDEGAARRGGAVSGFWQAAPGQTFSALVCEFPEPGKYSVEITIPGFLPTPAADFEVFADREPTLDVVFAPAR